MRTALQAGLAGALLCLLGCGSGGGATGGPGAAVPAPAFTFAPAAPTAGQAVAFSDTSTGAPTAWSWTFGDGGTSAAQNPAHSFAAAGTYTVTLRASNAAGAATASRTLTVASAGGAAAFTFSPTLPLVGQAAAFLDASGGPPTAWAWHFGDGFSAASLSTLQNPLHTFAAAGSYTVTLRATRAGATTLASQAVTVGASAVPAAAAFLPVPTAPVAGQSVSFRDTSPGSPTAWAWTFGDGGTSTSQSPTHTYAAAGTFTVGLSATFPDGVRTTSQALAVGPANRAAAFGGSLVLGSPTDTSVLVNVHSPDQSGTVYLAYGTVPGTYPSRTPDQVLQPGVPLEIPLTGLAPDTAHVYRLQFKAAGQAAFAADAEHGFHTARPAGSTFTFCLQGDSHPERAKTQFDATLYQRTLQLAAADRPDFYILMGDDFSVDTLDPATVTAAQVTQRYTLQRPYLGLVGASAPLFLVNGNHEQGARYLLDGTANNVAVWAQNARNAHYSQPASDGAFYAGNPEQVPHIGLLRNHVAWTWGDALFVILDPYWGSPTCVDDPFNGGPKRTNLWDVTHGDLQYRWLKDTLEQSRAKYKFVFSHHVLGTGRGGIELARSFEWGDTSAAFAANRGLWSTPIHALLVANKVTIFFQGHDHIWARQALDGVTYQTLSEPADPNYSLFNADAYLSGDKLPNTGYTRVTVGPSGVTVAYVRTWLPADEGPGQVSGTVAFSYTLP